MQRLDGVPASEGIAIGPAFVYHPAAVTTEQHPVADSKAELSRWRAALDRAKGELTAIHDQSVKTLGEKTAAIFEAQQMFLDDPALLDMVTEQIRSGVNAEAALDAGIDKFAGVLASLDDAYLRERAADVRDVGQRVLRALAGVPENPLATLDAPVVIVAADLTPSETAQMNRTMTLGFATARGATTAHTAILARSLGVPAVVGLGDAVLAAVQSGRTVIVDGRTGVLVVDPDPATLDAYRLEQARQTAMHESARSTAQLPAVTRDGHRVEVVANVGDLPSAQSALDNGAEGVGLLRTEFLFLDRTTMPDEEEQYTAYRAIATVMGPRPLVIRTLDVGGDKPPPYLHLEKEANPFLGLRAIRISLAHPELIKTQLRAILRAGAGYNIKLMFPMIATVEEVRSARRLMDEARAELEKRGATFAGQMQVGIMVEVPAAAVCAPMLAPEVDFFSLGTNDLIQYTLAVDRANEQVRYLYDPLNPAVLSLVKNVIDSAHRFGKSAAMCGEMAGDLDAVPLLLGMGLDEFSVNPAGIPELKALIRSLDYRAMQDLVEHVMGLSTASEIRARVRETLQQPEHRGG